MRFNGNEKELGGGFALTTNNRMELLAAAMGLPQGAVSVKATTEEGLGFTGAGEGIAVHTVCLLSERR